MSMSALKPHECRICEWVCESISIITPHTHLRLLFERSLDRREHLRFLCDASDGRKSHMTERGTEEISP